MTDSSEINFPESVRKRRALSKFFYVEILRDVTISSTQSLILFTALDARNKFSPLLVFEACAMFSSSSYNCVENCDILRLAKLPCSTTGRSLGGPSEGESDGLSAGGVAGIAVVVVLMLIAVLFIAIFYYRRKYKEAKVNRSNHLREVML